jgi:hypothetical protein
VSVDNYPFPIFSAYSLNLNYLGILDGSGMPKAQSSAGKMYLKISNFSVEVMTVLLVALRSLPGWLGGFFPQPPMSLWGQICLEHLIVKIRWSMSRQTCGTMIDSP